MQFFRGMFIFAAVAMLAGCSGYGAKGAVDKLNRSEPVGSPYTRQLAIEYRDLANEIQQGRYLGSADAKHFARKGLAAVDGMIVMPEVIEDWNIDGPAIAEIVESRAQLVTLLENGGRELAPQAAAKAQAKFDCWAAEGEMANGGMQCKAKFHEIMQVLGSEVAGATTFTPVPKPAAPAPAVADESFPAPVVPGAPGADVPVQQAAFMVFFDWDKYNISESGHKVLETMAAQLKDRADVKTVVVTGHTDTSGPEKYNQKLSLRRGNAARDALVGLGLPAAKIRVEGRGETDLLVKTNDNVREPQNRRAAITLE